MHVYLQPPYLSNVLFHSVGKQGRNKSDQNNFHVEVDNLLVPHCGSYNLRCMQLPFVLELGNVVAAAECMLLPRWLLKFGEIKRYKLDVIK